MTDEKKGQPENKLATVLSAALLPLNEETVRTYICAKATKEEIALFLNICRTSGLNPFKREVYLIKYGSNPASVVTGYEVYLKRAHRSKNWAGLKEGILMDKEGNVTYGWAEVFRKDWGKDFPLHHEVKFSEYVQFADVWENGVKTGKRPTKFWADKPETMIKKVAVEQALRMAFPDEFDGVPFAAEELGVDLDKATAIDIKVEPAMRTVEEKYPEAKKAEVHAPAPVADEFSGPSKEVLAKVEEIKGKVAKLVELGLSADSIHSTAKSAFNDKFGREFAEYGELTEPELDFIIAGFDKWQRTLTKPKAEKKAEAK